MAVCAYCGAMFKTKWGLRKHTMAHENSAPYKCCGKNFFEQHKLDMHRCSKHGEECKKDCSICGKKFPSTQQLKQHTMLVHEPAKFQCEICKQKFKRKDKLDEHISRHTGNKKHVCRACGKVFVYSSGLARHKKLDH